MHSKTSLFSLQPEDIIWIRSEKRSQSSYIATVGSRVMTQRFVNNAQCNQKMHTSRHVRYHLQISGLLLAAQPSFRIQSQHLILAESIVCFYRNKFITFFILCLLLKFLINLKHTEYFSNETDRA